jgi:hypothetical protein
MKFHSRSLAFCFVLIISLPEMGACQASYFKISRITYNSDSRDLSFPIIAGDFTRFATIEKINQQLQLSELELVKGFEKNNIFEKVATDNGTIYGGKVDLTYSVNSNNKKLFSVGFDESSCGMTCTYWHRYYNFNAGNGDLMQLSDLFDQQNFKVFKRQIVKKSIRNFKRQLHNQGEPDSVWIDVVKELGKTNLDDFYIKGNTLVIDGDNCLSKNQKGWDMIVKFGLPEFENYLNDYGKCVFGLNDDNIAAYKSNSLPQLFTGKIDKYPVTLILRQAYENHYDGIYCYQRYGNGISLQGTVTKGTLHLDEYSDRFDVKAHISGVLGRDSIVANWTGKNNSAPLKLVVYRK